MSFTVENLGAFDRLRERFKKIENPDVRPLMLTWIRIIEADNKRGVLAGLDKHGNPMPAVTYRPLGEPLKTTREQRLGLKASQRGRFGGFGPMASGLHNNLTSSEYRRLAGPPLAPRGVFSRVITNLKVGYFEEGPGKASIWGYWDEVVDTKGREFLKYHFHGIGQKKRDLTGVRPEGVKLAREACHNWMMDIIRSSGL